MDGESILVVSTNWIGDAVMSMPAIQIFRQENPDAKITVLARPGVEALWRMHSAIDEFQAMGKPFPTIKRLKRIHYDRAYIFPNSFRSAYVPFMAGIPRRIGARGHWRRLMLTETVRLSTGHQQFEYMNILGVQGNPPAPQITVSAESTQSLERKLCHFPNLSGRASTLLQALEADHPVGARPVITLLPGAARGPAKRWPLEHFIQLADLCSSLDALILLGGGPDDVDACAEIVDRVGGDIFNLAGQTTISEWAAMLKLSHCIVANDSGGMHLATAVGTPVVAIFGMTDPKKTGPLGHNIVLQESERQNRDIDRDSDEAIQALASVKPDQVFLAVQELLKS
jgi:heptosyltransferase-2